VCDEERKNVKIFENFRSFIFDELAREKYWLFHYFHTDVSHFLCSYLLTKAMNQMPIFFCILHARRHGRSIVMVGHKRIYDGDA
jgi:hypothetical protein